MLNNEDDDVNELALFGGQTRILVSKLLSPKPSNGTAMQKPSGNAHMTNSVQEPQHALQDDVGVQDTYSSLLQYMDLFPPSSSSKPMGNHDAIQLQTQLLTQTVLNGVSDTEQFAFDLQGFADSHRASAEFSYEPTLFDLPHHETLPHSSGSYDGLERDDCTELGMMMNGDSGIDEQWLSFMRDSGLMDTGSDNAL